ncbi:LysR family transcriptional regulator [Scandinavium sp. NPDC088450]|uniref:LysR family transcriptional regulator n=1 Tax=Scandinavium sp. NPDC088450 TaxID=3364514 RepID=UPI00384BF56E
MKKISLKYLKVIDALVEHKRVLLAAAHLEISPSSVSYVLKKVQGHYGIPLFTRTRDGMIPEPLAYQLQKEFIKIQMLSEKRQRFVISTYSAIELAMSMYLDTPDKDDNKQPIMFSRMEDSQEKRLTALRRRSVDIDIGSYLGDEKAIITTPYILSDMCVLARKGHPTLKEQCSLIEWNKNKHLRWVREGDMANTTVQGNDFSKNLLESRNVIFESASLLALVNLCAYSDHIMIMPTIFIRHFRDLFAVKTLSLPDNAFLTFSCFMHHHSSLDKNPKVLELLELRRRLQ